jgi:hypothetical protein
LETSTKKYVRPANSIATARFGDTVIWRPYIGASDIDSSPAIVTGVSANGAVLSLSVVPRDGRFLIPKESVRHASDPDSRNAVGDDTGTWDHRAD